MLLDQSLAQSLPQSLISWLSLFLITSLHFPGAMSVNDRPTCQLSTFLLCPPSLVSLCLDVFFPLSQPHFPPTLLKHTGLTEVPSMCGCVIVTLEMLLAGGGIRETQQLSRPLEISCTQQIRMHTAVRSKHRLVCACVSACSVAGISELCV